MTKTNSPQLSLSVVLPAHNEGKNLPFILKEASLLLEQLNLDYEIIVVDDGSTDDTALVVKSFVEKNPLVKLLSHPRNLGYGAALTSGFRTSTKELVFFMDSDRQFDIGDITKLLPFTTEFDIVAGYRLKRQDPWYRVMIGRTYNLMVITLFGVHLKDIDCAFKIYHRDVLDKIHFETVGALVNTEIMLKAQLAGKTIKEVGVNHYPRIEGKQSGAKPKVIIKAFWETLALWWKYMVPKLRVLKPFFASKNKKPFGDNKK
jgi:glycosyltransferase involved in cell wall biosynthesis